MTETEMIKQVLDDAGLQMDTIDPDQGGYCVTFFGLREPPTRTLERLQARAKAYRLDVRLTSLKPPLERARFKFHV